MTEREAPSVDGLVIGILGGTGDQGRGLAFRFARAGYPVIVGSRSGERARSAASQIGQGVQGMANRDAARGASVVVNDLGGGVGGGGADAGPASSVARAWLTARQTLPIMHPSSDGPVV